MATQDELVQLLGHAPQITCPRCMVEMTVRTVVPTANSEEYSATYRCPKCGLDTPREFTVPKPA
jgi:predicted RNA-binding Zn-ribbon protein involved in translation (DUF1610 family)